MREGITPSSIIEGAARNGGIEDTNEKWGEPGFYDEEFNKVDIKPGDKGKGIAYNNGYSKVKRTGTSGRISQRAGANGALHEIMHFFGLSDRYEDSDEGGKNANWGNISDIMVNNSIFINQTHFDNWGSTILAENSNKFTLNKFVDVDKRDGKKILGSAKK